jgi:hypothetical protein
MPIDKFEIGDRVRVVTTDTPFFGWTGEVTSIPGEIGPGGGVYYQVTMDVFRVQMEMLASGAQSSPLLFREQQLAHSK